MGLEFRRANAGDGGQLGLGLRADPCDRLDRRVVKDHVRRHPRRSGGFESPRLQLLHEISVGGHAVGCRCESSPALPCLDLVAPSNLDLSSTFDLDPQAVRVDLCDDPADPAGDADRVAHGNADSLRLALRPPLSPRRFQCDRS